MRKGEFAAYVKAITPYKGLVEPDLSAVACCCVPFTREYKWECPLGFCLTNPRLRRNYNYTRHPDGQTRTARSENARTQTDRDAQSTARCRHRSSIQRESVLRPEGSPASTVRDAPASCRREHVDSRRGGRLWGLAAHFLSGPGCVQPIWAGRLAAGSTRTKRGPQGQRRSPGLCGTPAGCRSQIDDGSVRRSHSAALRNCGPSAQSRARIGARQKKTAPPDLKSWLAHDAAFAYETLRPRLIDAADQSGAVGRSVLLRHGMLAWARAYQQTPAASPSVGRACVSTIPATVATELVQIMAGLILSNGREACHA